MALARAALDLLLLGEEALQLLRESGADIVVSGAFGGRIIDKQPLDADVEITKNGTSVTESRCLEIPLVQIRPRQDLLSGDPTGRAWVEMIAGAAENTAFMANRFSRVIDKILTNPFVTNL